MKTTYCIIRYLTPNQRREATVTYRWGDRWQTKVDALLGRGCKVLEVRVLRGQDWETVLKVGA